MGETTEKEILQLFLNLLRKNGYKSSEEQSYNMPYLSPKFCICSTEISFYWGLVGFDQIHIQVGYNHFMGFKEKDLVRDIYNEFIKEENLHRKMRKYFVPNTILSALEEALAQP